MYKIIKNNSAKAQNINGINNNGGGMQDRSVTAVNGRIFENTNSYTANSTGAITQDSYNTMAEKISDRLAYYKSVVDYFSSDEARKRIIENNPNENVEDSIGYITATTANLVAFQIYEAITGTNKVNHKNKKSKQLFDNIHHYLHFWNEMFDEHLLDSPYRPETEQDESYPKYQAYGQGIYNSFINLGTYHILALAGINVKYTCSDINSDDDLPQQ